MNLFFGVVFAFSIATDQLTKAWAVDVLSDGTALPVIGSFLRFFYVENRGAAFGILQDKRWFFIIVTIAMLCVIGYMFFKNKELTFLSKLSLIFIAGGAIGNFIDRLRLGYVVDFIDVKFGNFYDFPVFNIADSFVVCGTVLLLMLILCNKLEKSEEKNE